MLEESLQMIRFINIFYFAESFILHHISVFQRRKNGKQMHEIIWLFFFVGVGA